METKKNFIFFLLYLVTHVEGPDEDHLGSEQVHHRHPGSHCVPVVLVAVQLDLTHVRVPPHQVDRHLLVVLSRRPLYDLLGLLHPAVTKEPPHRLRHYPVQAEQQQQGQIGEYLEKCVVI